MSRSNRDKLLQVMFETFDVGGIQLQLASVCSLYASGRMTGLVVDSGHGVTNVVPVCEGYAIPQGIRRMNLGGTDLTDYMKKMLRDRGIKLQLSASSEREIV